MSIDGAFHQLFQTQINGRTLIDNFANRQIVISWLHEDQGEAITTEWFKCVLAEQPSLAAEVSWQRVRTPQTESNELEADKKEFSALAREHGLSTCTANQKLYHETHSIDGMAKASKTELGVYAEEIIEQQDIADSRTRQQLLQQVEQYLGEDRSPMSYRIREFINNPAIPLADVRERVQLVSAVANGYSHTPETNAMHFRKTFFGPRGNQELLDQANQIEDKQRFRKMSRQELKDWLNQQRTA